MFFRPGNHFIARGPIKTLNPPLHAEVNCR